MNFDDFIYYIYIKKNLMFLLLLIFYFLFGQGFERLIIYLLSIKVLIKIIMLLSIMVNE